MKVLLKFSLGKDSVITLGRLLDNPAVTDIALVYHPMPTMTYGIPLVGRKEMGIFEDKVFTSLSRHAKIKHIFPISFEEHELASNNIVTDTITPSEWFLMTGDMDTVLIPEYLMKVIMNYGYRGLLTDKMPEEEFYRNYDKYITTTLVRSGMCYFNDITQKNIQLELLGKKFSNADMFMYYEKQSALRQLLETVVVESPLYDTVTAEDHTDLVIDLSTVKLEDAIHNFTDTGLNANLTSVLYDLLKD